MLESMEDLVRERGENILFILSGQITTYHGANYVMPTMMKLAASVPVPIKAGRAFWRPLID